MKRTEAEYLLGGYATGTLSEVERRLLFAAALDRQAIFDALMDEEALRELLADPAARAQLLAALAPEGVPKVVPFWRRTGLLGAAASLLVASLAGLAYLRSPSALPAPAPAPAAPEAVQEPATKAVAAPPAVQAPGAPLRKAAPATPPKGADQPRQEAVSQPVPAPRLLAAPPAAAATEDSARMKEQADLRRGAAQDQLAKKAEAPRPAAAAVEVASSKQGEAPERRAAAQDRAAGSVPGGVPGGVIGGVVGGVVGGRGVSGVAELSPSPSPAKAKAVGGLAANAAVPPLVPTWVLEVQPDGRTRVTVSAPRGRPVTLLRRGVVGVVVAGVEVVPILATDDRGQASVQWRAEVRLAAGDALDLYLLNAPVAEPARLPESGPVDGFRVRIHPASKK